MSRGTSTAYRCSKMPRSWNSRRMHGRPTTPRGPTTRTAPRDAMTEKNSVDSPGADASSPTNWRATRCRAARTTRPPHTSRPSVAVRSLRPPLSQRFAPPLLSRNPRRQAPLRASPTTRKGPNPQETPGIRAASDHGWGCCHAEGRGFESLHPLSEKARKSGPFSFPHRS